MRGGCIGRCPLVLENNVLDGGGVLSHVNLLWACVSPHGAISDPERE